MAKRGGKRGKRAAGKRKGGRKFRPVRNVPDLAKCSVSFSLTDITGVPYTANQMYNMRAVSLSYCARAVQIAKGYQHYRIKKISVSYKPQFDTFAPIAGAPGFGAMVPQMYYMIDKSGSLPTNVGLAELKQMGSKPHRFDDKNVNVSWRPSVLSDNYGQAQLQSSYRISPWLSTNANALQPGVWNPSDVDHLGLFWFLHRPGNLPPDYPEYTYDVQVTVEFEFKKPLIPIATSNPESISITPNQQLLQTQYVV